MIYKPFPHQAAMTQHLIANEKAGLLVGVGLGKTSATLAALDHLFTDGAIKGVLILAPLRVSLFTWRDEVAKWDQFRWMKIYSLRTDEGLEAWHSGKGQIFTLNFESAHIPRTNRKTGEIVDHGILGKLLKGKRRSQLPVDVLVVDELSKAKNPSSKRFRYVRKFREKFSRRIGLTGTPAPNSLLDLFAQVRLIDDGERFGNSMGNFKTQYFQPTNPFMDRRYWKWGIRPECKGMIESKMSDIFLTQRSEDYLDIPPTEVIDVDVQLPAPMQRLYRKLEKEMLVLLKGSKIKAVNAAVLVGKLQQVLGGSVYADDINDVFGESDEKVTTHLHDAKVDALRSTWNNEGREPMIAVVKFRHERDAILRAIPEAKAFHSDLLDDWNAGDIPMLVVHAAQMSHGLNMQGGGSRVCWFSLTYSLEDYDQLNARVIRTGQESSTTIFRLIAPGTIDDAVAATLDNKSVVQKGLMATLTNLQTLAEIR